MEVVLRKHPAADPLFSTQEATCLELMESRTGRLRKLIVLMPGHGGFLIASNGEPNFFDIVANFGFKIVNDPDPLSSDLRPYRVIVHGEGKKFELFRTTDATSIEILDPASQVLQMVLIFLPGRLDIEQMDEKHPEFTELASKFLKRKVSNA